MNFEILKLKTEGAVAVVTISRPKSLNALNTQFFHEMDAMIHHVATLPDVKVMIITGEGKAFVAGADIAEMVDKDQHQGTAFSRLGQHTFRSLEKMAIPVIAAINGFALGGGLELAMACDLRIAADNAKFGQPEVNLGLIPGYAATQRLPRLVGMANALYLLMTALTIDAAEALRIGLVQKVTQPENLMEETLKIANTIAAKGPKAVRIIKEVTRQAWYTSFDEGQELEAVRFGSLFGQGNQGEIGMRAFLKKEKPVW
jgi:enoyl-CoA hydratase